LTLYFLTDALARLAECSRTVPAADTLFRAGDPVKSLYLVVSGALRLTRVLPHGAELVMQRAEPGAIVAETSLFADRYCCNAVAIETSLVRAVRIQEVQSALRDDCRLLWEWVHHMAREVQQARARAEILSLKTVAHRIEGWRALNNGVLPPKGRWRHLADEIGVSPEALYREFARRG
jgi:CRP-like cAMP-binding protein